MALGKILAGYTLLPAAGIAAGDSPGESHSRFDLLPSGRPRIGNGGPDHPSRCLSTPPSVSTRASVREVSRAAILWISSAFLAAYGGDHHEAELRILARLIRRARREWSE